MSAGAMLPSRISQLFLKAGRRLRPVGKQVFEEGRGTLYSVPQLLRSCKLERPFLLIGGDTAPWGESLRQNLEENDVPFTVWQDPGTGITSEDGEALAASFRGGGWGCFLALGGPEIIDLAKAAAARAACGGKTISELAGRNTIRRRTPPVVAIPTAAGAGAEALGWATVSAPEGHRIRLEGPALRPGFAVYDPSLMTDVPRAVLARCVMEGLCLAVEAGLSRFADESVRTEAAQALGAFFEAAEPCWNSGGSIAQRGRLMEASRLAGTAATAAGAGYVRALCDAAASVSGLAWESVCAPVLPGVLEAYGSAAVTELAYLAEASGLKTDGARARRAEALIERIRQLAFRMGLPESLEQPAPEALDDIAALAAADANPRWAAPAVWSAADCGRVLRAVCTPPKTNTTKG